MMAGRLNITAPSGVADNTLGLSWHDSAWIPILNTSNVMDYFSQSSNPFFDRTCNNEIVKMQRLNQDQLQNMTGLEYVLLHVQEPILYVIRKQHRHSPQQVTPLSDYYIMAGIVYQAPDIGSVLNSRLLSAVHHLQSSFEEASSFSRYHPSKGYYWDFKSQRSAVDKVKAVEKEKPKEESSSLFQRQRVDMLLGELIKKFPLPAPQPKVAVVVTVKSDSENGNLESKEKVEVKQEKIKPPADKKPRLN
ncbi:mediator of RNA polymerase II transcription subunit 6 [Cylas formicarius]|uniref:mediator of RNA polymerase II transcription subunit 6 n=1 Tax=Cylas formicarius TaxID=197179 RepID=UPI0029584835|nr:mediator of RNA polymerase II transcription subunit 6 [Cylas formicarius]